MTIDETIETMRAAAEAVPEDDWTLTPGDRVLAIQCSDHEAAIRHICAARPANVLALLDELDALLREVTS